MGHPKAKTLPESAASATDSKIKDYFMKFDTNRDGKLSKQELKMAFRGLGSRAPWLRALLVISRMDENRDGYISDHELNKLVEFIHQRGYNFNFTA
ncbi:hypothetical protein CRG98_028955 [Punica granatum]|uniref:EF-hand domain-containing protein n=1 Tax=Punica granatum TaxID=22663 RepID=A0A2I0J3L1_PUNGR|nr:hypothetical protein CRG98_028955 [Punica granatum]